MERTHALVAVNTVLAVAVNAVIGWLLVVSLIDPPTAMLNSGRAVAILWLAFLIVAVMTSGWRRWWLLPATFLFAAATLSVFVAQYGVPA